MSASEAQLVAKAKDGDRMAFRALVLELSPDLYRLACRLTRQEAAAEDVVQEAFIKAHERLAEFREGASFRTWMHRITVNAAMDHLRREKTRGRYEGAAAELDRSLARDRVEERPAEDAEIRRRTGAALTGLTDLERAAVTLRHFEGHSIAEVASALDLSPNACKQAIFRAVRKLRSALTPLVTP